jgi:hypothetical protein
VKSHKTCRLAPTPGPHEGVFQPFFKFFQVGLSGGFYAPRSKLLGDMRERPSNRIVTDTRGRSAFSPFMTPLVVVENDGFTGFFITRQNQPV